MKNNYNFIPNHKVVYRSSNGEELVLKLDVDYGKDLIREIDFDGDLISSFEVSILKLKELIKNLRPDRLLDILVENNFNFSIPIILVNKFLEDYQNIQTESKTRDLICACFGVTKSDLVNKMNDKKFMDLKELNSCTSAGLGCGSCIESIRTIYIDHANENYRNLVVSSNITIAGNFVKIGDKTLAAFLIEVDRFKDEIFNENEFIINSINGVHFEINNFKSLPREKMIALQKLILKRSGVLVFFH